MTTCDEEEIANIHVLSRDSAPLHESQRKGRQSGRESSNGQGCLSVTVSNLLRKGTGFPIVRGFRVAP